jgi:hypothetical protein
MNVFIIFLLSALLLFYFSTENPKESFCCNERVISGTVFVDSDQVQENTGLGWIV